MYGEGINKCIELSKKGRGVRFTEEVRATLAAEDSRRCFIDEGGGVFTLAEDFSVA
jgi:hypothetical protein